MDSDKILHRRHAILGCLTQLPRKMLSLKEKENITEFVMHELCKPECFNLEKAAYFVDNPDFDCLKGIVGIWRPEVYTDGDDDIWQDPQSFSAHMQGSPFNQTVRGVMRPSLRKNNYSDNEVVEIIGRTLHMTNPGYYAWDMKHDNHGLLVYEKQCKDGDSCDLDTVINGLSLLAFCPIF